MIAIVVVVAWLVCGWIGAAGAFAYFQHEYPTLALRDRMHDARFAFASALLFGPIALIVEWVNDDFRHGYDWSWWRHL